MTWACRLPYVAAAILAGVPVRRWLGPSVLGGMGGSYRKAAMLAAWAGSLLQQSILLCPGETFSDPNHIDDLSANA